MAGSTTVGILRALLTADTAEFTRAMSGATKDVQGLGQAIQRDLEPRQRAVNAAVRDFLGGPEIRRAEEYAMAIAKIGDVSQLTAQDQLKVNKAVSEALDHYKALGVEAPAHLVKLQKDTTQVTSIWQQADEALGKFGLSLKGLTLAGVGAGIIGLGKEAIAFSDRLGDLKAKTGLTYGELQRLSFAGEQVGVDLNTAASGVQKLQRALVEDKDGGAGGAIWKLGLDVQQLLAMSPGQMFETISAAIAKIPDPAHRTAASVAILGKSAGELLPLMVSDINDLTKGMRELSDRQVENVGRWDDAWARMKMNMRAEVGQMIDAATSLRGALELLTGNNGKNPSWMVPVDRIDEISASLDKFAQTAGPLREAAPAFGATGQALDDMVTASQRLVKETEAVVAAHEAHRKKIAEMGHEFTAAAVAEKVRDLAEALAAAAKEGGPTDAKFQEIAKQARALREQGAALSGELFEMAHGLDILDFSQRNVKLTGETLPAMLKRIGDAAKLGTKPEIDELTASAKAFADHLRLMNASADAGFGPASIDGIRKMGTVVKEVKKSGDDFDKTLDSLASSFATMGQASDGALSTIVRQIGAGVTALSAMKKALDAARESSSAATTALSAFSAISAAIQIGQTLQSLIPSWESGAHKKARSDIAGIGQGPQSEEDQLISLRDRLKAAVESAAPSMPTKTLEHYRDQLRAIQDRIDAIKKSADDAKDAEQAMQEQLDAENGARDRLQAAVEKYGFTIDELGPKWAQQKMNEQAKDLILDFEALKASGVETGTIVGKMGENLSDFANMAKKTGVEVPEQMRPILQKALEMGQLFDDNGVKLDDLSGINFGTTMTMTEGFQGVIDKLSELIAKITGDLGRAIVDIPQPHIQPVIDPPTGWTPPAPPPGSAYEDTSGNQQNPQLADGGLVKPRAGGTKVTLGEAGYPETVLPGDWSWLVDESMRQPSLGDAQAVVASRGATLAMPSGETRPIIVKTYLDGRQVAEAVVPRMRDVVASYGLN